MAAKGCEILRRCFLHTLNDGGANRTQVVIKDVAGPLLDTCRIGRLSSANLVKHASSFHADLLRIGTEVKVLSMKLGDMTE